MTSRVGLGCLGSTVLFAAVLVLWGPCMIPDDTVLFETEGPSGPAVPVSIGALGDMLSLVTESDSGGRGGRSRPTRGAVSRVGHEQEEMLGVVDAIGAEVPATRTGGLCCASRSAPPKGRNEAGR